ncbi:hypothetical protein SAMN05421538_102451 [Paracoccus isoporae]|uniref:Uncharacterized protein n=1 Tax=Paracoccus isoporae TaxID=591205 RepID=A0A1G6XNH7_9RHOB|nr:hypothetical protein [Paracoccus isoporae]SDD79728.1 hypothetical protein SAMN05421538_102451 [Paracoccus isoporae]
MRFSHLSIIAATLSLPAWADVPVTPFDDPPQRVAQLDNGASDGAEAEAPPAVVIVQEPAAEGDPAGQSSDDPATETGAATDAGSADSELMDTVAPVAESEAPAAQQQSGASAQVDGGAAQSERDGQSGSQMEPAQPDSADATGSKTDAAQPAAAEGADQPEDSGEAQPAPEGEAEAAPTEDATAPPEDEAAAPADAANEESEPDPAQGTDLDGSDDMEGTQDEVGSTGSVAEPETEPAPGEDSTAPENAGNTGWTGGTGGAQLGTTPSGATPESKTWQPPVATGIDLQGGSNG